LQCVPLDSGLSVVNPFRWDKNVPATKMQLKPEPFVAGGSLDRSSLASDETISASAGPDDAGGHEPACIAKSAQAVVSCKSR